MEDYGPASDRILPIQIRPDVTVRFLDIPHDLTLTEARKIAAVVEAMAAHPDPQAVKTEGRG